MVERSNDDDDEEWENDWELRKLSNGDVYTVFYHILMLFYFYAFIKVG